MPTIQTTKVFAQIEQAVRAGYTTISLQGSARASKTYNTLIWLIHRCLTHPNTRLSIVRATLPSIKGSVFVDFKEILINMGIFNEKKLNKSELTYQFDNGSWCEFFSCDSEQKLRGRKRDILFVNEANELMEIEWEQLKMRTTQIAIIDYNPSFSDEHWICGVNKDKDTYHFITTYKDNPFLEDVIVKQIEGYKEKNPTLWQVYGLGLQAIVEGLVFEKFEEVDSIPSQIKTTFLGCDWGYQHDPTAIVEVGFWDDAIYIDEWCYRTEMLTSDIIRELKAAQGERRNMKIISESADPRMTQEIYRAGLNIHPVVKFAGSIDAGIQKWKEYKIYVTKRSYNAKKELKNYTYQQDKEGHWLNKPIDAFNHIMDAVRYVVMTEKLGGERRKVNSRTIESMVY